MTTWSMTKLTSEDIAHLKVALIYADLSKAKRAQVGCIIVKENRIISIGYNGTPSGWANDCEDSNNQTKPEVLHAETNAIAKLARCTEGGEGATLYCTHAACLDCAKLIYQSGIRRVVYARDYAGTDGVDFLKAAGVKVDKL
jgi:dCMP deaminase